MGIRKSRLAPANSFDKPETAGNLSECVLLCTFWSLQDDATKLILEAKDRIQR